MQTNENPIVSVPLMHDGDSFNIEFEVLPDGRAVLLHRILRFPGNANVTPILERIMDLDRSTRAAIVRQINRKYPGRSVRIK